MNKEERAAFLRWMATASGRADLESTLVRMEAVREALMEEGPQPGRAKMIALGQD